MPARKRRSHSGVASPSPQASSSFDMLPTTATPTAPNSAKLQKVLRSLQIDGTAALVGEAPAPPPVDEETYIWHGGVYVKTADTKPEWIEDGNRGIKRRCQSTPRPSKRVRSGAQGGHDEDPSLQRQAREAGDEGGKGLLRDDSVIHIRSSKRRRSKHEDTEDNEDETSPAYQSPRKKLRSLIHSRERSPTPRRAGSTSPARRDRSVERDITPSAVLHKSSPLRAFTRPPAMARPSHDDLQPLAPAIVEEHPANPESEVDLANDRGDPSNHRPQSLLERLQDQGNPHALLYHAAAPTAEQIAALERVMLSRPSLVASTGYRELDLLENTHALSKTNDRIESIRAKFRQIIQAETTRERELGLEKARQGETSLGAIQIDDSETSRRSCSRERNESTIRPDKEGTPQKIAKLPTPVTPGTIDASSRSGSQQRNLAPPPSPPPEDEASRPTKRVETQQGADGYPDGVSSERMDDLQFMACGRVDAPISP